MTNRRGPIGSAVTYFGMEDSDWNDIRGIFDGNLPEDFRPALTRILSRYLERLQFEQSAFNYRDANAKIKKVVRLADDLRSELVGDLAASILSEPLTRLQIDLSVLKSNLLDLTVAGVKATETLAEFRAASAGHKPGEAWRRMVNDVLTALEDIGIAPTIWATDGTEDASPTLRLLARLERAIPGRYRKPDDDDGEQRKLVALKVAVMGARSEGRKSAD